MAAKLAAGSKRKSHVPQGVPGYKTLGGHNAETSALRNALAAQGVVSPATGKPYTEAFLLGVGGGIGFGYFVFEAKTPYLVLGTRNRFEDLSPAFIQGIAERLSLTLDVNETDNDRGASNQIVNAVRTNAKAAICWVDLAALPWQFLPADVKKYVIHAVSVFGLDEDAEAVLVDDRALAPFIMSKDDLAAARTSIEGLRNRSVIVMSAGAKPDLQAAVSEGIEQCVGALTEPASKTFGLDGIAKWSELLVDAKDKKGWATQFADGHALVEALVSAYNWLELMTGGAALRPLYASFLEEAGAIVKKPKLGKVAEQYRALGVQWSDFAQALLPENVARFKYVREALLEKHKALTEKGQAGIGDVEKASKKVASTKKTAGDKPLTPAERKEFFAGLSEKLEAIHAAEKKAATALANAMK